MTSRLLINQKPKGGWTILVALSAFLLLIAVVAVARQVAVWNALSLCEAPDVSAALEAGECAQTNTAMKNINRLYPSLAGMGSTVHDKFLIATDVERGDPPIYAPWRSEVVKDTAVTLGRFLPAVVIAMAVCFLLTLLAAASGYTKLSIGGFSLAWAYVPAIGLTPFFFQLFPDSFHLAFVAFGLIPVLLRDLVLHLDTLPESQKIKAQTIHASTLSYLIRVLVPQLMPRLIDATRVTMGLGWILVLAAGTTKGSDGLGHEIFLVKRRYVTDNLLPLVIWVTVLAVLVDLGLWGIKRFVFPWTKGASQ